MARLPTPMEVNDLRFTGNTELRFTVKWESDDDYADMIDHIRVRFMMTNLSDIGVDDATLKTEVEGWDDLGMLVAEGKSAADIEAVPSSWDGELGTLHRIDYRGPHISDPGSDNATAGDDTHEATFTITDASFQQRFVRLFAQARTAD